MAIPGDETPLGGRPPPARDMGAELGAAEQPPVTEAMITPHTSSRPSPAGQEGHGFVCHVCKAANPARASYCLHCGVRHQRPDHAPPPADPPPPEAPPAGPPSYDPPPAGPPAYDPPPAEPPSYEAPPPSPAPPPGEEPTGEWAAGEWDLDFSEYDRIPGADHPEGEGPGGGPLPAMPGEEPVRPGPAPSPFVWRRAVILFVIGAAVILAALTLFRSGGEPEEAPTTTTLPAAQESAIRDYVAGLQAIAGEVAALGSSAEQVNQAWDERTQNFDVTRSGLISIQLQAADLPNQLDELASPVELSLENRVRLQESLRTIAEAADGMVAGLESPDTGEARSRALTRFQAAVAEIGWLSEAVIEDLRKSLSPPTTAAAP